jgi:hypothetical protein
LCRNCLLRQVIEGKIKGRIEVTGRWGRRRRKLLADLKERRGYSLLKEEALNHTVWTARFGRGFGPFVRYTAKLWYREIPTSLAQTFLLSEPLYQSLVTIPKYSVVLTYFCII